jgi:hypothetical protein
VVVVLLLFCVVIPQKLNKEEVQLEFSMLDVALMFRENVVGASLCANRRRCVVRKGWRGEKVNGRLETAEFISDPKAPENHTAHFLLSR